MISSTDDSLRQARLVEKARIAFGRSPAFVVRAPGRVNLLGEHTDYNMLPVLPMAIERCTVIAGASRSDRSINLRNAGGFPDRSFEVVDDIPKFAEGDWGNYVKAAAQGLTGYYGHPLARGADLIVDGDIPQGAGLSSSSALVVASALALLAANEAEIPFETLAGILPRAERYVGTLSGGMDQTVSLLAQQGHALRIDFAPLRYRPVPLPPGHAIVVCHSLVRAEKSGTAKQAYNQRVIECRLACRALEKALGRRLDHPLAALGDLAARFPTVRLSDFVDDLSGTVPDSRLDLAQLASLVGTGVSELRHSCGVPEGQVEPFSILARTRHVLTEAERVDGAEAALEAGDAASFGELMDASHRSCRDDYEISCPELEALVAIAKEAGAIGARLTGAGFGGCTVNLVAGDQVDRFTREIDRRFYRPRLPASQTAGHVRFVFTPQAGARTDWL